MTRATLPRFPAAYEPVKPPRLVTAASVWQDRFLVGVNCFRFPSEQSRRRLVSRIYWAVCVAPGGTRMPPRGAAGVALDSPSSDLLFLSQPSRSRVTTMQAASN
jgi:hypothetical protein